MKHEDQGEHHPAWCSSTLEKYDSAFLLLNAATKPCHCIQWLYDVLDPELCVAHLLTREINLI